MAAAWDKRDAELWRRSAAKEQRSYPKRLWRLALSINLPAPRFNAFKDAMRHGSWITAKYLIWPYVPVPPSRPRLIFQLGTEYRHICYDFHIGPGAIFKPGDVLGIWIDSQYCEMRVLDYDPLTGKISAEKDA